VINNYFGMNRVGQRMYASNGNACDISVPEIIEYYGDDPETHVIVLHSESFSNPEEFLRRVKPVAARKPILALKSGVTVEGARAVSSHTGGLMERDTTTDVLFDASGVLRFSTLAELCEAAQAFATQKIPRGNRLGLVTNAGSPAIIVTDEVVKAGWKVPDLSEPSKAFLREKLQSMASVANPIDMMATASGNEFGASLQALVDDPGLDAAVICFMTPFFVDTLGIARAVVEQSRRTDKTLIAVAMTNPGEKEEWRQTVDMVREAGVPVYYFPESAARVLHHMDRFRRLSTRPRSAPPALGVDRESAAKLLRTAELGPEGFLAARDASRLLSFYGVPLAGEARGASWDEVRAAAARIGFPVVLKAEAPALVHKTESGAVALDLADERALKEAFEGMQRKLAGQAGLGFLVQKQLGGGIEVIVGGAKATGLGSMIMFGLGGIHVEVLRDVVFKLAPLCLEEADEMLSGIAAAPILAGVRGKPGVDRRALADLLLRVSRLLADHPEISELDCNPVMASPSGATVVDARVRVSR
jgi:acetyltransferase